jgi:glycosyltransferase involved in cell wall biosynthesis
MKILYLTHRFPPDHFRGTEVYTFELAREMKKQGHQVLVVAVREMSQPAKISVARGPYRDVDVARICKHLKPEDFLSYFFDPEMDDIFSGLAAGFQPDLIHATYFTGGLSLGMTTQAAQQKKLFLTVTDYAALCPRGQLLDREFRVCPGPRQGVRCLFCLFDRTWLFQNPGLDKIARDYFPASFSGLKKHPQLDWLKKRNDAIQNILLESNAVVFSHPLTKLVFDQNQVKVNNPKLTDFGVEFAHFQNHKKSPTTRLRIGFIGQVLPHKGLHLLVDALAGIEDQESFELLIYGSVSHPSEKEYFNSLNLSRVKNQKWLGTFDYSQMNRVLEGIDLLVVPSIWPENCPLTPKYAVLTGTRLLISDQPGILVKSEGEGIEHFETGNRVMLRNKIEDLIKSGKWTSQPAPRQDLVMSIQEHCQALLEIYQERA